MIRHDLLEIGEGFFVAISEISKVVFYEIGGNRHASVTLRGDAEKTIGVSGKWVAELLAVVKGSNEHGKQLYKRWVAELQREHCPNCDSFDVETTCMANLTGPDRNRATCNHCYWTGLPSDLI